MLLKCACLCACSVLITVKFFDMLWLQTKLDLFSVHVVLYIHLCSKAHCVISQTGREGGTDKVEEKKRGGGSLEASNPGDSECCSDTVLHQDRLPDML